MDEDDSGAAVELGVHLVQSTVALVDAAVVGEDRHARGVQVVEGEPQLGQRGIDIGQRQRGEEPEAVRPPGDRLGGGLVERAGDRAPLRRGAKLQGHRNGQDGHVDGVAIHHLQRVLGPPTWNRLSAKRGDADRLEVCGERGTEHVVVDVDHF
jgi:hypothetical protein